ncbi:unnamed protein product [Caenorhabditis nigoni]
MDCYFYTQVYQMPMVAQEDIVSSQAAHAYQSGELIYESAPPAYPAYQTPMVTQQDISISQAPYFYRSEELVYHSVPQCLNSVPVVFDDSVPFNPCSSNNNYSGGNQLQPASNSKLKTRLCASYAKGGSLNCRYGLKCNFVHPTDNEYAALFPETEEFARLKQALQDEVQKLHLMKKMAQTKKEEMELEGLINYKVRKFNLDYPKGSNYYDLHDTNMPSSSSRSNNSRNNAKKNSVLSAKPAPGASKVNQNNGNVCEICGGEASCLCNGVTSCHACRAFYYRRAKEVFECRLSKNCDITVLTRNECQFCRFQKCRNLILRNQTQRKQSSSSAPPKMPVQNRTQTSQFDRYARLLMTPLEDGAVLDTKSLCDSISREMKDKQITQKVFAKKVANLSHYYLPRILKNPKPWEHVPSLGRMTFIRLHNWINLPERERMEIVNSVLPKRKASTRLLKPKQPQLKFTDVQKKTLAAIFEETQKPTREIIEIISEHLGLEFKTVLNYFNRNRQRQLDLRRQQNQ